MILRNEVVLFTGEGDNTVVEIFGTTITVLLNVHVHGRVGRRVRENVYMDARGAVWDSD